MKHRYTFPVKGIEALIQLVKKHDLASLQVDGITIIPRGRSLQVTTVPEATGKATQPPKPLSSRDLEDLELFGGPNSISGPINNNLRNNDG
jgi:hypothetical protein